MKFNVNALRAFWAQLKLTAQTQFEQGKQAQLAKLEAKRKKKEDETNGRVPK